MPDVSNLDDFVTGTLRFSGSVKNGVPILVKHGKVHDQKLNPFAARHAEVDSVAVPEEEEKIFVSMDMIRDEIISLQEHYDKIQEYASNLQQEVERLEAQLKSQKSFDGRLVLDRANEQVLGQKTQLEAEVASLQARLDQANRRISNSAIENDTLAQERDRVFNRLQEACEDINKLTRKLGVKEKELETTSKQLGSSEQTRQENDTLRRDLVSLKQGRESMELENTSLRTDNESLRQELKRLREETESLRSDNNSLRTDHQSLLSENRSLRTNNKSLMDENEDLRENVDGLQHELDAAREEVETLQQELQTLGQEKSSLREDNDSLVRHNEKYFSENKILRRENSGFERSIHNLHDENLKLKEEVEFLKEQLDHCRPIPRENLTVPVDEDETEENMTSAFFVPDITMNSDETGPVENTRTRGMTTLPEVTAQTKDLTSVTNNKEREETRDTTRRDNTTRTDKSETRPRSKSRSKTVSTKTSGHGQKVAFSIPEKTTQSSKSSTAQANRGSKRKSASRPTLTDLDPFGDNDDTTGLLSIDNTATEDQAISLNLTLKSNRDTRELTRELTSALVSEAAKLAQKSQQSLAQPPVSQKKPVAVDASMQEAVKQVDKDSCPALSTKARRVLDNLCGHSCQNCIVCSRITSHSGVVSSAELAAGKKRVIVPRPVPVSDKQAQGEDMTVRPAQSPGHALALVIKGLEDESQHLQLELTRLQAQYNGSDKSHSRRQRLAVAEAIRMVLKRLEVKNDQIYSLYDVLEGQKAAGQAMSEEEIELTVLSITGMTVRDVTGGMDQTWEGIMDS
ncbi:hypothetical protein PT974_05964 [Cladobotryum mycophilum]|uniref:Cep57 centrosome microtubule-binding domain-containing protein n=1 Tax=Cladobotryum mycophilum TaxID=491253 RepID=A0ABR0SL71_9HYPO